MSLERIVVPASPACVFDLSRLLAGAPSAPASPDAKKLETIRASGLFDAAWYLEHHPDVRRAGIDPLRHYHQQGWRAGYRPNGMVDKSTRTTRGDRTRNV